jgi:murein L,D-transpeptidase YcbB/YkuD
MIYLHDTPAKSLFNREDRAFSHGCIRVEKPVELATQILKMIQNGMSEKLDHERWGRKMVYTTK